MHNYKYNIHLNVEKSRKLSFQTKVRGGFRTGKLENNKYAIVAVNHMGP